MKPHHTSTIFWEFYGCFVYFATISWCEQTWRKITMSPTCFLIFNQFQGYGVIFWEKSTRSESQKHGGEPPFHPKKLIILLCVGEPGPWRLAWLMGRGHDSFMKRYEKYPKSDSGTKHRAFFPQFPWNWKGSSDFETSILHHWDSAGTFGRSWLFGCGSPWNPSVHIKIARISGSSSP
jgi:hypothetical protein